MRIISGWGPTFAWVTWLHFCRYRKMSLRWWISLASSYLSIFIEHWALLKRVSSLQFIHTHTYTSTNMRMYPVHKYAHKHTQRHNKYRKKQACTMHKNIHTQTHKIHIHCTEHGRFCCWATQVLNLVLTSVENTFKCWRRNLWNF